MTTSLERSTPKLPKESIFLVSKLSIFILTQNFAIRQIPGRPFQILHLFLKITAQKYPNKVFLLPNSKEF